MYKLKQVYIATEEEARNTKRYLWCLACVHYAALSI
jgi:hypothetical protein